MVFNCVFSDTKAADAAPPVAGRAALAPGVVVGVVPRLAAPAPDVRDDTDEDDGGGPAEGAPAPFRRAKAS